MPCKTDVAGWNWLVWGVSLWLAVSSAACQQDIVSSGHGNPRLHEVSASDWQPKITKDRWHREPVEITIREYKATVGVREAAREVRVPLAEVRTTSSHNLKWYTPTHFGSGVSDLRIFEAGQRSFLTWHLRGGEIWFCEITGNCSVEDAVLLHLNPPISRYATRLPYRAIKDWLSPLPGSAGRADMRVVGMSLDSQGRPLAEVAGKAGWPSYLMRLEEGQWHRASWFSSDRLLLGLLLTTALVVLLGRSTRHRPGVTPNSPAP